jgi:HAD superfamily hydrolase (TIGR01549 family)
MGKIQKIGAVAFDCDGVMFDSREANINFYNHLLTHFGLPPMEEDVVDFVHMHTADESIRHIFQGTPHVDEALAYRREMDYAPFIRDMVFGLAVATNRSNTIGDVLETHGLKGFFDIVVSSLDVENPKPHPEPLLKILDFFQLSPDQTFYVGDSAVDFETSRGAGVVFIAYKNRELEADFHVDSLMGIRDVVG